jgi:hypothetical protein
MNVLTFYSRPECHLCDEMFNALQPLIRGKAEIRMVDISNHDELEVRYGLRIPVLADGDDELCCYKLDVARVRQWLAAVV